MDNPDVFDQALGQYRAAYISVGLARQPETALQEPRNKILAAIQRLQTTVDMEGREIRDFSRDMSEQRSDMERLAQKAKSLETDMYQSRDELTRTKHLVGETPPPPDYSPVYRRLGIIGGLFLLVVGLQVAKARV